MLYEVITRRSRRPGPFRVRERRGKDYRADGKDLRPVRRLPDTRIGGRRGGQKGPDRAVYLPVRRGLYARRGNRRGAHRLRAAPPGSRGFPRGLGLPRADTRNNFV